jgi:hypothetical protein
MRRLRSAYSPVEDLPQLSMPEFVDQLEEAGYPTIDKLRLKKQHGELLRCGTTEMSAPSSEAPAALQSVSPSREGGGSLESACQAGGATGAARSDRGRWPARHSRGGGRPAQRSQLLIQALPKTRSAYVPTAAPGAYTTTRRRRSPLQPRRSKAT